MCVSKAWERQNDAAKSHAFIIKSSVFWGRTCCRGYYSAVIGGNTSGLRFSPWTDTGYAGTKTGRISRHSGVHLPGGLANAM